MRRSHVLNKQASARYNWVAMTYDYFCASCDEQFEFEQSIKDDPLSTCPKCHSQNVKRLISGGSFVLKGDGWAKDLYSKPQANVGSDK